MHNVWIANPFYHIQTIFSILFILFYLKVGVDNIIFGITGRSACLACAGCGVTPRLLSVLLVHGRGQFVQRPGQGFQLGLDIVYIIAF
jgi:hypothetical protein